MTTTTERLLDELNKINGLEYPAIRFSYFADIKGDGRNIKSIYTIINAGGGVRYSTLNAETPHKRCAKIRAEIDIRKALAPEKEKPLNHTPTQTGRWSPPFAPVKVLDHLTLESAMCLWEQCIEYWIAGDTGVTLSPMATTINQVRHDHGVGQLRYMIRELIPLERKIWPMVSEKAFASEPYDWEFCPWFLEKLIRLDQSGMRFELVENWQAGVALANESADKAEWFRQARNYAESVFSCAGLIDDHESKFEGYYADSVSEHVAVELVAEKYALLRINKTGY